MRPRPANSPERGAALLDTLTALAILAVSAATVVPQTTLWSAELLVDQEARRVWHWMVAAQTDASRRGQTVGLQWYEREGRLWGMVVVDGNGNGIVQADLDAGIDTSAGMDVPMFDTASGVGFRIPARVRAIDDSGWLEPGSDPIRFGRTDRVSFTPDGRATPGTVYVAGRRGSQYAVRVSGATGRVQLLRYRRIPGDWVP
jgi:hypothetical protein